jgi:hypothetical protein
MLLLERRCINRLEVLKSTHRSLSNNLEFLDLVDCPSRYIVNVVKSVGEESTDAEEDSKVVGYRKLTVKYS